MDDGRKTSGAPGLGKGRCRRAVILGVLGIVAATALVVRIERFRGEVAKEELNGPEARAAFAAAYPEIQGVVERYLARPAAAGMGGRGASKWRAFLETMQDGEMAADFGTQLLALAKRTREDVPEYGEMVVMLTLLVDWHTMYREDRPGWVQGALERLEKREAFEGAAGLIAYARTARMMGTDAVPFLEAHGEEIKGLAEARGRNADLALMLRAVGCRMERFDDVDVGLMLLVERNNALYTRTRKPAELAAGFKGLVEDLAVLGRTAGMTEKQKAQVEQLQETFARSQKEFEAQANSAAKTAATIEEAGKEIQAYITANGGKLPTDDEGAAAIGGFRDVWGHALRYTRRSESTYGIRSAGPGGRFDAVEDLDDIVREFPVKAAP